MPFLHNANGAKQIVLRQAATMSRSAKQRSISYSGKNVAYMQLSIATFAPMQRCKEAGKYKIG
jgi:hypothetical protein